MLNCKLLLPGYVYVLFSHLLFDCCYVLSSHVSVFFCLQHDQYRALDFPDMDDSLTRVVASIKENRSQAASALTAPLFAHGAIYFKPSVANNMVSAWWHYLW